MRPVILLIVIYLAFVSLGLPDGVFGVAWPVMRTDFAMPLQMAGVMSIILMSFSAASSFMNGRILHRFGTGRVTFISSLLTGLALLGFSLSPSFGWLLLLAIPLGIGGGGVDSSLNNYVAKHYSSRHMNWLHCFWGLGATIGPYIMTKTLAGGMPWRNGYRTIAIIQLCLAVLFFLSLSLWKGEKRGTVSKQVTDAGNPQGILRSSFTPWLGIFIFFIYCGTELTVGLWANSMLVEARHIPQEVAGLWISYYYGALMLGRFLTGLVVNRWGNRTLIRTGLIIAFLGGFLVYLQLASVLSMVGLILIGLGLAPIYPCMMHETPKRFDPDTSRVLIGYQVGAACLGGSSLSALLGVVFAHTTLELLAPCVTLLLASIMILTEWLNKRTPVKACSSG